MGKIQGYTCPRCNENFGYLHIAPEGIMYFCGQLECLKDDADSSKGKESNLNTINNFDAAHKLGLGSRYVNACLSKWSANHEYSKLVSDWIKNPIDMLVLIGKPNTGKTYFCAALANFLMKEKMTFRYFNPRRFIEEIQKSINNNESQYSAISRIASCDFLILDDLGSATNNEWQQEIFFDLIDRRYSDKKPTVITTNLIEVTLNEALGQRLTRRIFSNDNLILHLGEEYVR